jgi:hypothetical protein
LAAAGFGGASPRVRRCQNGETPSSARRRRGKYHHPAPARGCACFEAPRGGAPPLTERLQRPRDPGPASAQGAPGIQRMRLALSKSIALRSSHSQVRPGNGRGAALFQIRGCQVHRAFHGRTWHLQVHLQFSRAHRALSRCTCSPRSTGAPWEWQVRPVSNKRVPGAPGNLHPGAPGDLSPGAPGISRCAWHLQVHLVRALLVKARLSGRY